MPKKINKKMDGMRLLRNKGDGSLECDIPGRMTEIVKPGDTILVSTAVADHYLNDGTANWIEAAEEGEV